MRSTGRSRAPPRGGGPSNYSQPQKRRNSRPAPGPPLPQGGPPRGPPLPQGGPSRGPPLPQGGPPRGPIPQGGSARGPPIPQGGPPRGPAFGGPRGPPLQSSLRPAPHSPGSVTSYDTQHGRGSCFNLITRFLPFFS